MAWASTRRTRRRVRNQVENRSREYGGSRRWADTPAVFSISLRTSPPGLAPMPLFASGAVADAILPSRSVRPITFVVAFALAGTCFVAYRTASARSMSRGKSIAHSCWAGVYGQLTWQSLHWKHSSTTWSCSAAESFAASWSSWRSMNSNSVGNDEQNVKHRRQPWHRS